MRRRRPRAASSAPLIATALGLGALPVAPGTWGSLGALAVLAPLRAASPAAFAGALAMVAVFGTWAAERTARADRDPDPRRVVIDEVLGMGLTLLAVRHPNPASWLAAFLLFRLFDILKPPPLRALERLPGGFGIMADDVGAAAYAAAVLCLLGW